MLLDFLEQTSTITKVGTQIISYGDTPHSNPNDFDSWYEPFATAPQPWMWFGGKWYSNVLTVGAIVDGLWSSSLSSALQKQSIPISHEYDDFDVFLRRVTFDFQINTAHSGTAFWNFAFKYFTSSSIGAWNNPAFATVGNFSTSTFVTGTRLYRQILNVSAPYVNCKGFFIDGTKTGAPSGFNASVTASFRLMRK
jgi:hypothetical protein